MSRLLSLIYSCSHVLALPWALYRLGSADGRRSLAARFGYGLRTQPVSSIWLHASSVGEVSLLEPLVRSIEATWPQTPIVFSAYTAAGLTTARRLYAGHRTIAFPIDLRFVVKRFMRRLRPRLVVVAESEVWPNFFNVVADAGVPLAIVNGKMSDRSLRLHMLTRVGAMALRRVDVIAVQAQEHANRFAELGVDSSRIRVTGNMKYDLVTVEEYVGVRAAMRARLRIADAAVVVVGGSLHEREDEVLIEAIAGLEDPNVRLVLVPRYPADAEKVRAHARARGLNAVCLSQVDSGEVQACGGETFVVDTLGELRALYAAGDIAFVGGSLFYRGSNKGGHNLMEPAVYSIPVLFGPYNYSFRETAGSLTAAQGGIEVTDPKSLSAALTALINDPKMRRTMGATARRVVLDGQGATARNFALLKGLLAGQRH
jgi:3-deoxy-D-manno-octulosonic-acid transferase